MLLGNGRPGPGDGGGRDEALGFLVDGGRTGALMRALDWSASPLGAPEAWPQPLRSAVGLMLGSRFPMFVAWGPELRFLYNDAYADILGDKHPAALGGQFRDIWSEIWSDISPFVDKAMSGEATWTENLPLTMNRHGYDERTSFTFSYSPVRDDRGAVTGMCCICTETTAKVTAEKALRASEARARGVLEGMAEGFLLLDRDFRTVQINAEGLRLEGRPASEILGRSHWEAYPGAEHLPVGQLYKRAMRHRVPGTLEHRWVWPDGHAAWLELRVYPSPDGLAVFYRDVTERREREEALREAEARLRALADNLPGGMAYQIATARDGSSRRFLYVSQGFERMTGVPAEAVLADPGAAYGLILPEYHERLAAAERAAIRDLTHFDVEVPLRSIDGEVRWTRIVSAPRLAGDDTVIWDGIQLDTTARRVGEERLRESETRLRLATEAADVGLWDVDLVNDTMFWQPRVKAMFGISPDVPCSMADYYAGLHPDEREATSDAFAAALDPQRRAIYDVEYRTVGKEDGVVRWVSAKGRGLFSEDGRCERVIGTAVEITARKRTEEALRASEEQFRVLSQVVPNLVWSAHADGQLYWCNDQAYEYSGVRPGGLDGTGWAAVVHPDDRDEALLAWRAAVAARAPFEAEFRMRRADGTYRWFLNRARPVLNVDGSVARWVGTNTDIHGRRSAMDELVRSNEVLGARVAESTAEHDRVWRNSRDLLVVLGPDGVFRAVNPAWEAILGHAPEEVVGRSFLEFIWPEDADLTRRGLDRAAAADNLTNFENRYRHKDGTPRRLSWHTSMEGGLVYGYGRDVTAEKEQAEALRQAEEALRQSQKLEAVGQLTGGVAHDFNNLLTIIRSSVDFLRRPELSEERKGRYLNAVSDTVERAAKLTGQLLAFARRQALKPETLEVGARLRAVADLLDTVTGARIRVVTEVPESPCFVRLDLSQFEMALVNMAVNARDAMDGAGTLTLRLSCGKALPSIRGHAGAPGPFAAVSLADTGGGIPPEVLTRIFEPFFTTKAVGKGTGLGLSQVFGFTKQSGGDVEVASEPGRGTTFTLYLPEVAGETPASEEDKDAEALAPCGTGQRVLVVEDNVEVGRFATQILEDLGYATTWAVNAEEALDKLGSDGSGFDVVFSDVVMPGMGGIELAKVLRRRLPNLPVVLASGYSHVLAQEGNHGFEVLQKPYSADQVSRMLRTVAGRKRRRSVGPAGA